MTTPDYCWQRFRRLRSAGHSSCFPDPWPKKRHHKRRIIAPATLDLLAAALADESELRVASDDAGYVRWALAHVLDHGAFDWEAESPKDWRERPKDWPQTRYEAKAREQGRRCYFLRFVRRKRGAENAAANHQIP